MSHVVSIIYMIFIFFNFEIDLRYLCIVLLVLHTQNILEPLRNCVKKKLTAISKYFIIMITFQIVIRTMQELYLIKLWCSSVIIIAREILRKSDFKQRNRVDSLTYYNPQSIGGDIFFWMQCACFSFPPPSVHSNFLKINNRLIENQSKFIRIQRIVLTIPKRNENLCISYDIIKKMLLCCSMYKLY